MRTAKIILIGTTLLVALLFCGCSEEEPQVVPDVYVNFEVNLSLPQFTALNAIGNAVKKSNEGYNKSGVIIYRRLNDPGGNGFSAFDATCPQHIALSTAVNLDGNGTAQAATCPHCSTTFHLENNGYPAHGYPLKRYRTTLVGSLLRVTN